MSLADGDGRGVHVVIPVMSSGTTSRFDPAWAWAMVLRNVVERGRGALVVCFVLCWSEAKLENLVGYY